MPQGEELRPLEEPGPRVSQLWSRQPAKLPGLWSGQQAGWRPPSSVCGIPAAWSPQGSQTGASVPRHGSRVSRGTQGAGGGAAGQQGPSQLVEGSRTSPRTRGTCVLASLWRWAPRGMWGLRGDGSFVPNEARRGRGRCDVAPPGAGVGEGRPRTICCWAGSRPRCSRRLVGKRGFLRGGGEGFSRKGARLPPHRGAGTAGCPPSWPCPRGTGARLRPRALLSTPVHPPSRCSSLPRWAWGQGLVTSPLASRSPAASTDIAPLHQHPEPRAPSPGSQP